MTPRITVVGAGYVGLVTGACFAHTGHDVTVVEIEESRLAKLQAGELPIYEPGLDELVRSGVASGRLRFTKKFAEAVPQSEFAFVAVHTPEARGGGANTSYVVAAVRSILEFAHDRLTIVVKSTVPVGTGDMIQELVAHSRFPRIRVVSSPEFIRQGRAIRDFMRPERVVVGANPPSLGADVALLHGNVPTICCTRRSAELAKYVANALLAARVSFMNEVALIADAVGAEIDEVTRIVGTDSRIGPAFLRVGVGWGGSCLPKDTSALRTMAMQQAQRTPILDAVADVNARMREWAFAQLRESLPIHGGTVAVLGLAFKPDTDDLRGSPAMEIIERLLEEGISVRAHDPRAMSKAPLWPNVRYCGDAYDAATGSDALLLVTEWQDYVSLDWRCVRDVMRGAVIVDGRNALDAAALTELGFLYFGVGRRALVARLPVQAELAVPATSHA